VQETRKIFRMPDLPVFATTVRVPTFHCHGEAVTVELASEVSRDELMAAFEEAEGVELIRADDHALLPTPRQATGRPEVFVSRVRIPHGQSRSEWASFWNVSDNLKKGAATNAVQIL